jgi:hypothetical protein
VSGSTGGGGHRLGLFIQEAPGPGRIRTLRPPGCLAVFDYSQPLQRCPIGVIKKSMRSGAVPRRKRVSGALLEQWEAFVFHFITPLPAVLKFYVSQRTDGMR